MGISHVEGASSWESRSKHGVSSSIKVKFRLVVGQALCWAVAPTAFLSLSQIRNGVLPRQIVTVVAIPLHRELWILYLERQVSELAPPTQLLLKCIWTVWLRRLSRAEIAGRSWGSLVALWVAVTAYVEHFPARAAALKPGFGISVLSCAHTRKDIES